MIMTHSSICTNKIIGLLFNGGVYFLTDIGAIYRIKSIKLNIRFATLLLLILFYSNSIRKSAEFDRTF